MPIRADKMSKIMHSQIRLLFPKYLWR